MDPLSVSIFLLHIAVRALFFIAMFAVTAARLVFIRREFMHLYHEYHAQQANGQEQRGAEGRRGAGRRGANRGPVAAAAG